MPLLVFSSASTCRTITRSASGLSFIVFPHTSRGHNGSGGNQFLLFRIDTGVETFKRPRAEQRLIARLGKNHFINRKELISSNDGKACTAGDALSIGHQHCDVLLFAL